MVVLLCQNLAVVKLMHEETYGTPQKLFCAFGEEDRGKSHAARTITFLFYLIQHQLEVAFTSIQG